ncbi:MAG: LacI family DNA-binding transcriptional regulator [Anaerolineae bacterium]|nr:LacI family DNA-binding transcriptional regulator [Anaerolineae bacterium]
MRVTMKEIAQKANVSIKTVSRVVNGQGEISAETVRRVQEVIDEFGYRPNLMARSLVTQRTNSIGLIVPNISNPFYPEVAQAVLSTARESHHNMLLCSHENDAEEQQQILDSLVAQGVDGIIIFPALRSHEQLARFADTYEPLVVVNDVLDVAKVSHVQADIFAGATRAVEYLVEKGHRSIAMINAVRSPLNRRWREQGFRQAMIAHDISPAAIFMLPGDQAETDIEGGYDAAKQLLTQHPKTTAIFCYNDMMAIGALRACQELGRDVPRDCAIIGFDDIAIASIIQPALTTIRINKFELGTAAAHQLLQRLEGRRDTTPRVVLDVDLIVRQSA